MQEEVGVEKVEEVEEVEVQQTESSGKAGATKKGYTRELQNIATYESIGTHR